MLALCDCSRSFGELECDEVDGIKQLPCNEASTGDDPCDGVTETSDSSDTSKSEKGFTQCIKL